MLFFAPEIISSKSSLGVYLSGARFRAKHFRHELTFSTNLWSGKINLYRGGNGKLERLRNVPKVIK